MSRDTVRDTCGAAGLRTLCRGTGHPWGGDLSLECSLGSLPLLPNDRQDNVHSLAKVLCPGLHSSYCDQLDTVFFYAANYTHTEINGNSSAGVLTSNSNDKNTSSAVGSYYTSGKGNRALYAACIKEGGE